MILTVVRSPEEHIPDHPSHTWVNENMGFVTDEHLMNVAITRAREALCIIGRFMIVRCEYKYYIHSSYTQMPFAILTSALTISLGFLQVSNGICIIQYDFDYLNPNS